MTGRSETWFIGLLYQCSVWINLHILVIGLLVYCISVWINLHILANFDFKVIPSNLGWSLYVFVLYVLVLVFQISNLICSPNLDIKSCKKFNCCLLPAWHWTNSACLNIWCVQFISDVCMYIRPIHLVMNIRFKSEKNVLWFIGVWFLPDITRGNPWSMKLICNEHVIHINHSAQW